MKCTTGKPENNFNETNNTELHVYENSGSLKTAKIKDLQLTKFRINVTACLLFLLCDYSNVNCILYLFKYNCALLRLSHFGVFSSPACPNVTDLYCITLQPYIYFCSMWITYPFL